MKKYEQIMKERKENDIERKKRERFFLSLYRIAGIFRGGKFLRKPLQLYYSNYSRAEFSRNAPSSVKNYPFCTELTVRAALCNHTLARHLFAG